ncbi:glycosyl transferase family 2 [Salinivibrio proteolyticus]|uniref:glycosyltransferase n=1 Tax=Salinivibrio proteolyticus TaxID=334715 RepID=UPI0009895A0D|nr:glycosyltransferase [Salinivibrio proteolyticus]OOF23824.1 glycosyl transferase family 2 [Salinivibrio proteolyticus]
MEFSVLMSVYFKEDADWLNQAMRSVWDEQTLKPNEIVLVKDGPLTPELDDVISIWRDKLGNILQCIPLEENVGLGDALNIGLKYCSNEIIARMDTDDIALPQRFEKQLVTLQQEDVDICSAWITEFDVAPSLATGTRKIPEYHDAIAQYAKLRNPINHPAVMYKKSAVEKAGGYRKMMWFEDYYLWVRMLLTGSKFYNIQEPLVLMRAGMAQLERRSGISYAKSELALLNRFRSLRFLTGCEYCKALLLRIPVRVVPVFLVRATYKYLR